jgi:hypothetical protein
MDNESLLLEISQLQSTLSGIHNRFITLANADGIEQEDRAIYVEMLMWANTTESTLRSTSTALLLKPDSKLKSELVDLMKILSEQIMETKLKLEL